MHELQYEGGRAFLRSDVCRSSNRAAFRAFNELRLGAARSTLQIFADEQSGSDDIPPFYQLIFEFPKNRLLHTPSFVGMHYTDDLIILELVFLEGRSFGHAANTGALKVIIEA